jgi:hypothetical protein
MIVIIIKLSSSIGKVMQFVCLSIAPFSNVPVEIPDGSVATFTVHNINLYIEEDKSTMVAVKVGSVCANICTLGGKFSAQYFTNIPIFVNPEEPISFFNDGPGRVDIIGTLAVTEFVEYDEEEDEDYIPDEEEEGEEGEEESISDDTLEEGELEESTDSTEDDDKSKTEVDVRELKSKAPK